MHVLTVTFSIQLDSHRNVSLPRTWVETYVSSTYRRDKYVFHYGVLVFVATEYLKVNMKYVSTNTGKQSTKEIVNARNQVLYTESKNGVQFELPLFLTD